MKSTFLFFTCLLLSIFSLAQKIDLGASNVFNVTIKGDAGTLVDEQSLAGDPKAGKGGKPVTAFSYGTSAQIYYPLEVIIDLWASHNVTDFYLFDINNIDSFSVSTGTPGNWTPVIRMKTDQYMSWRGYTINKTTRYLRLVFRSGGTLISEIVLYGTRLEPFKTRSFPAPVAMSLPAMEDFIGINSFHDVPDSLNKVAKHIREYHNWGWDEGNNDSTYKGFPNNQYGWDPSWVSGSGWGWNFDDFYGNSRKKGMRVSPALQLAAPYIVNFDNSKINNKPLTGSDSYNPASYKSHADWMYQYAARYGAVKIPLSNLKLRPDNRTSAGLGYLDYIENWNEPDKNWFGKDAYFSPFELAAMCSADYDGHMSTLGKTFGVKNADPKMKFVMGGLANADTSYISAMIRWSEYYRNGSFPADILNFHHYSNDGGGQGVSQTKGYSPEEDKLKEKIATLVAFRDQYLPGKEIWLSEFGYDTNPSSVQGAPAIGAQNTWETQARWIIRSYLAIAAGGADRAYMFMLRDVNGTNGGKFSSSGLTTAPSGDPTYPAYTKKNSWYYLYAFRKRLTGYRFKEEVTSGNPNVWIYSFEKISNPDSIVYAVWAPTRQDLTVTGYKLQVPLASSVTKVELVNKDTLGVEQPLIISGGQVTLNVDEKPDLLFIYNGRVTGIIPDKTSSFRTYPNPCSSVLNIELPEEDAQLYLMDLRGYTLKESLLRNGKCQLQMEDFPDGLYILQAKTDQQTYMIKIVKGR